MVTISSMGIMDCLPYLDRCNTFQGYRMATHKSSRGAMFRL